VEKEEKEIEEEEEEEEDEKEEEKKEKKEEEEEKGKRKKRKRMRKRWRRRTRRKKRRRKRRKKKKKKQKKTKKHEWPRMTASASIVATNGCTALQLTFYSPINMSEKQENRTWKENVCFHPFSFLFFPLFSQSGVRGSAVTFPNKVWGKDLAESEFDAFWPSHLESCENGCCDIREKLSSGMPFLSPSDLHIP